MKFPDMANSIDRLVADLIITNTDGGIVLVKRKNDPYKGMWALPGGMMEAGETIEQAAVREAREETSLEIIPGKIVGVYSSPNRDPRGRYVSVAFAATVRKGTPVAGDDAAGVMTTPAPGTMTLAFDHNQIIADYLKMKQGDK